MSALQYCEVSDQTAANLCIRTNYMMIVSLFNDFVVIVIKR